jgi:GTP-dependent phosphoenolpyruvate carboxykinase
MLDSWGDLRIPVLLFADDMVLMGDGEEELERIVAKVKDYCEELRLEVNVSKSKEIVVSQNGEKVAKVKYGEEELECVN